MSYTCCTLLLANLCAMSQSGSIDLTAATVVARENGAARGEDRRHGTGRRGRQAHWSPLDIGGKLA